jgi:hypothetical protein
MMNCLYDGISNQESVDFLARIVLLPLELMLSSVDVRLRNAWKKKFEIDATALDVSKVFCLSLKEKQNEHQ